MGKVPRFRVVRGGRGARPGSGGKPSGGARACVIYRRAPARRVAAVLVFPRASPDLVRAHLPLGARVVAVDAGAEALRAVGVVPDRLVGDLDSVSAGTLLHFERLGVPVERHPARKRDTDAALALAGLRDEEEILFLGPGGGRVDHALANLHLLAAASAWARAWSVDEDAQVHVAAPGRPVELRLPIGSLVSVIPFDARCEGIRYAGLRYHLDGATMTAGDPYGMSNVCEAVSQRVEVQSGRLLVVVPTGQG